MNNEAGDAFVKFYNREDWRTSKLDCRKRNTAVTDTTTLSIYMAEKESHSGTGSEHKDISTQSSIAELIKFLIEQHRDEREQPREEIAQLIARLVRSQASSPVISPPVAMTTPSFPAFNPTSELWKGYWDWFQICMEANSISTERQPKVFLTIESSFLCFRYL